LPKGPTALVANKYLNAVTRIAPTLRLDINPVNVTALAEKILPHFEAATSENPDLDYMNLLISEPAKMSLVDLKIMTPLLNPVPLLRIGELLQYTWHSRRRRCFAIDVKRL
jgi:hypothetical protein